MDEALAVLEAKQPPAIVIDPSKLDFMDSTGLHLIVEASRRATSNGWKFAVLRGPEQVQRVFEVTGLDTHFDFVNDVGTIRLG